MHMVHMMHKYEVVYVLDDKAKLVINSSYTKMNDDQEGIC